MGVRFVTGDIFQSAAQTLAHGCNCRGRMGAGIALEFKRRYPEMFKEYRRRCRHGLLVAGGHFLYKASAPWILNLATQDTSRGAQIELVEQCFLDLAQYYRREGITSLALPRIAAGLGGLDWYEVKSMIREILGAMTIPLLVFESFEREMEMTDGI